MLLTFADQTLAVVEVEERSARAEFVTVLSDASDEFPANQVDTKSYRFNALLQEITTADPNSDLEPAPRHAPALEASIVYEALADDALIGTRFERIESRNRSWNILAPAVFEAGDANRLAGDQPISAESEAAGYLYFRGGASAGVLAAGEQVVLRQVLDQVPEDAQN